MENLPATHFPHLPRRTSDLLNKKLLQIQKVNRPGPKAMNFWLSSLAAPEASWCLYSL